MDIGGILGFDYGIVQAPLGPDISSPDLVAAVANAGGLGLLRAPDWESPDYVRELIRKTRSLTDKPFGVGVILAFPHKQNLRAILDEKVAVVQVYWGECSKDLVDQVHSAGVKIIPQIGSVEEARNAVDVGVDAIIVQGREAGGHVIGQEGLISILPRVVDIVGNKDIPVIAAGGISDSRGYVAALALGARGVCLGTRFVATEESHAHPTYKRKLVELDTTDYTNLFGRARWPGAPQRVLQTPFYDDCKSLPANENESNQPVIGRSTINGLDIDIRRFAGTVPNASAKGDIESMAMYAGQGVGLIKEILPAGEVVRRLVEDESYLINGYQETIIDCIPGMNNIQLKDLSSFAKATDPNDIFLNFVIQETERARKASAIVLNTFDTLEQQALDVLSNMLPPVYTIGPVHLLLNQTTNQTLQSRATNLWKENPNCLNWFNSQQPNSVIYVNFGSVTVMTSQQLIEFAWRLANSGKSFLWIIRHDLVVDIQGGDYSNILPIEFFEEVKERAIIGSWCAQVEVLKHPLVAGFFDALRLELDPRER